MKDFLDYFGARKYKTSKGYYKRITHRQPLITLSMSGEGKLKKEH